MLVFVTNIAGAVIFSLLASHIEVVFNPYRSVFSSVANELMSASFLQILLAGILAGWPVALIAWLVEATEGSITHVVVIYVVAYLIVGLGLYHCIIGSTEVLMGMSAGAHVTWLQWLTGFLAPTTLGNVVGGVTFVTGLKGFQAASGKDR